MFWREYDNGKKTDAKRGSVKRYSKGSRTSNKSDKPQTRQPKTKEPETRQNRKGSIVKRYDVPKEKSNSPGSETPNMKSKAVRGEPKSWSAKSKPQTTKAKSSGANSKLLQSSGANSKLLQIAETMSPAANSDVEARRGSGDDDARRAREEAYRRIAEIKSEEERHAREAKVNAEKTRTPQTANNDDFSHFWEGGNGGSGEGRGKK